MQNDIFFAKYLHISKTFCNFVAKLSFCIVKINIYLIYS